MVERALDSTEVKTALIPAKETADWEERPEPVTSAWFWEAWSILRPRPWCH